MFLEDWDKLPYANLLLDSVCKDLVDAVASEGRQCGSAAVIILNSAVYFQIREY